MTGGSLSPGRALTTASDAKSGCALRDSVKGREGRVLSPRGPMALGESLCTCRVPRAP